MVHEGASRGESGAPSSYQRGACVGGLVKLAPATLRSLAFAQTVVVVILAGALFSACASHAAQPIVPTNGKAASSLRIECSDGP